MRLDCCWRRPISEPASGVIEREKAGSADTDCDNAVMGRPPPPPSSKLVALLVLGGAGLGLVAVGVTTPWGWTLFAPGFIALVVSLLGAWIIQESRDKTLR